MDGIEPIDLYQRWEHVNVITQVSAVALRLYSANWQFGKKSA